MKTRGIFSILFMVLFTTGYPEVIVVPDEQPTIQEAIDMAETGDTVLVNPGTYPECINFNGKQIVVGSMFITTGDSTVIMQTIINANGQGSAVTFASGETQVARLIGFTLTNGTGTPVNEVKHGGGIYCLDASPTLENLRIVNNSASGMFSGVGGGVFFDNSQAILKNSFISGNEAYYGAGVRVDNSDVTIENTWFADNYAVGSGAGLMFYMCPSSRVTQSVFTGNQSIYGGAIAISGSNPVLDRITCFKNHGLYGGSLNVGALSTPVLINSICWQNAMQAGNINEIYIEGYGAAAVVAYSDIEGGEESVIVQDPGDLFWMEGNMDIFPEFSDTANMKLELDGSSLCIDMGKELYIYAGDTIVNITNYKGLAPDMGAYEYDLMTWDYAINAVKPTIEMQILSARGNDQHIVRFELSHSQYVTIAVYNIQGKLVEIQENRLFPEGKFDVQLQTGGYQSGVYVVSLISGRSIVSKKFVH